MFESFWSIFYRKIILYHFQVDIWIFVHYSTPLPIHTLFLCHLHCNVLSWSIYFHRNRFLVFIGPWFPHSPCLPWPTCPVWWSCHYNFSIPIPAKEQVMNETRHLICSTKQCGQHYNTHHSLHYITLHYTTHNTTLHHSSHYTTHHSSHYTTH